ncbi:MAG TPA: nicotinate-nucleotide adenylyltransferase [Thermoanaerobaculia bacterium]|nr:nicotinate-nucleotide adenylyltransferase [Thermoanaerobaculia bacterium]
MKIAICGGTFDPFHRGHLDPVLAVRNELQWSAILYVPAWRQPFKPDRQMASGYHRFAMAVLATTPFDDIYVSPMELDRGRISYTVDTLEELRGQYVQATLDWVIGDDNLAQLGAWKNIDRIFELANFVVLSRHAGGEAGLPPDYRDRVVSAGAREECGGIVFAANATVPISSTEIRSRLRTGESIAELVDPLVSRYIQHYRLYQEVQT